ncbi:MAG: T9SS type A sorting domain-containing protein [Bacteroidetes bacterium]|nr:T9SS type A sorting domain-containing protein [Bacteroidota bacterium]
MQFPVHSIEGMIEVYDLLGNKVLEEYISPWSQFKSLDLINFPKGIYMCKLNWKDHTGNIKIIKQ